MTRTVTLSAALVGAVASLVSIVALPWAYYGDIAVPVTWFPEWGIHMGSVLALQGCVAWAVLTRAGRRPVVLAAVAASGLIAGGSAVILALGYDDAPALFDGPIPTVVPRVGLGGIAAVLAIFISMGAAAASRHDRRAVAAATPA